MRGWALLKGVYARELLREDDGKTIPLGTQVYNFFSSIRLYTYVCMLCRCVYATYVFT